MKRNALIRRHHESACNPAQINIYRAAYCDKCDMKKTTKQPLTVIQIISSILLGLASITVAIAAINVQIRGNSIAEAEKLPYFEISIANYDANGNILETADSNETFTTTYAINNTGGRIRDGVAVFHTTLVFSSRNSPDYYFQLYGFFFDPTAQYDKETKSFIASTIIDPDGRTAREKTMEQLDAILISPECANMSGRTMTWVYLAYEDYSGNHWIEAYEITANGLRLLWSNDGNLGRELPNGRYWSMRVNISPDQADFKDIILNEMSK